MTVDWPFERSLFPAAGREVYLMNASVGLVSKPARDAYVEYITALHEYGELDVMNILKLLGTARNLAATHLQAPAPEDIAFVTNSSYGMNLIACLLKEKVGTPGEILLPEDEFPTSTVPWYHHGFHVKRVPTAALLSHVGPETQAVLTSAVQFSTGYRQNLKHLGEALAGRGIPFFVNATQSLGAFPLSIRECKISALVASCHKWFCAGYGTAIMYLSPEWTSSTTPPFAGWLSVENPFAMTNDEPKLIETAGVHELGTLPFATIAAVKASFEHIARIGQTHIARRILELSSNLANRLSEKGFEILSPRDELDCLESSHNSGIVSIASNDPEGVATRLKEKNIFVNTRKGSLRLSTHYYNNIEDIDRLVAELVR